MNQTTNVVQLPSLLTPCARVMRREGQTQDRRGNQVLDLNPGEACLDWTPRLVPLFSFPYDNVFGHTGVHVRAGNAVAIVREGYEANPLGIATDYYRPVNHLETVREVSESTMGRCTLEGALIDGHGYHVVHSFKLDTLNSEKVIDLPLISRLTLVHDHTGAGSLRASVVSYLGNNVVIGSRNFTRRIHVGAGALDVGVGSVSRWVGVLDAMLETASLQQGALAQVLRKAAELQMTEEFAEVFEKAGVSVERVKISTEDQEKGVIAPIVPATPLNVVIEYHKQRKGRLSWGVWSRRLEGDALGCLEKITGITLPKQLFRKGGI